MGTPGAAERGMERVERREGEVRRRLRRAGDHREGSEDAAFNYLFHVARDGVNQINYTQYTNLLQEFLQ